MNLPSRATFQLQKIWLKEERFHDTAGEQMHIFGIWGIRQDYYVVSANQREKSKGEMVSMNVCVCVCVSFGLNETQEI